MKAMGVLFVEFLAIYRASTTLTTMLMGAMSFAYSITCEYSDIACEYSDLACEYSDLACEYSDLACEYSDSV